MPTKRHSCIISHHDVSLFTPIPNLPTRHPDGVLPRLYPPASWRHVHSTEHNHVLTSERRRLRELFPQHCRLCKYTILVLRTYSMLVVSLSLSLSLSLSNSLLRMSDEHVPGDVSAACPPLDPTRYSTDRQNLTDFYAFHLGCLKFLCYGSCCCWVWCFLLESCLTALESMFLWFYGFSTIYGLIHSESILCDSTVLVTSTEQAIS